MKAIILATLLLTYQSVNAQDSIRKYILRGTISSIVSLMPLISGITLIMDENGKKAIPHSTVFFGAFVMCNVSAIQDFKRAKFLKQNKIDKKESN